MFYSDLAMLCHSSLPLMVRSLPFNKVCSKLTTEPLKRCEICSKLLKYTGTNVIGVVLVFLLLTLNIFHTSFYSFSIVDFEQVNVSWDERKLAFKLSQNLFFDILIAT